MLPKEQTSFALPQRPEGDISVLHFKTAETKFFPIKSNPPSELLDSLYSR
jgi:hypothetical protein